MLQQEGKDRNTAFWHVLDSLQPKDISLTDNPERFDSIKQSMRRSLRDFPRTELFEKLGPGGHLMYLQTLSHLVAEVGEVYHWQFSSIFLGGFVTRFISRNGGGEYVEEPEASPQTEAIRLALETAVNTVYKATNVDKGPLLRSMRNNAVSTIKTLANPPRAGFSSKLSTYPPKTYRLPWQQ